MHCRPPPEEHLKQAMHAAAKRIICMPRPQSPVPIHSPPIALHSPHERHYDKCRNSAIEVFWLAVSQAACLGYADPACGCDSYI